ncbi:helix-turn-helix domain-containing protein [Actinophytocola sp. NPDC049390]|uniref:helix-turn-helix domain-containing protein n=1 Tax=Actinophytocola sp. NPDC049390 TaxID=3363894 RepID=UPI0037A18E0E
MGGDRRQPRPRNRRIGARLRAIRRQRTDFSLEEAAELLGWSPSTLSRTENGIREITSEEVATIVTAYRLPAPERAEIIRDARADNSAGWWDKPLPGVPEEMGVLASYAAEANSLTDWAVSLIPGLLQIEPYAMAVWQSGSASEEDAQLRWVARKRRQKILGNIDYTAFIHETALFTPFGGHKAHREQLLHLASARDRGIGIRIMPRQLPYGGVSHSWLYMTFPNTSPVVNVEVAGGGVYLFDDQAKLYTERLALLNQLALSTMESTTLLRTLVREFR